MSPEAAAEALRDPAVPVRPAEEGPEKGAPMVALESVLRNQGPPHLNPIRARLAVRSFVAAAGKLWLFDRDLALSGFRADEWEELERHLARTLDLVMELQAALDRVRSGRPHVMGPGQ
jgi:hypothetical protein